MYGMQRRGRGDNPQLSSTCVWVCGQTPWAKTPSGSRGSKVSVVAGNLRNVPTQKKGGGKSGGDSLGWSRTEKSFQKIYAVFKVTQGHGNSLNPSPTISDERGKLDFDFHICFTGSIL